MSTTTQRAAIHKALGHRRRIAILDTVAQAGDDGISPTTIADTLGESLPLISYHVRALAQAQLLDLVSTRPRRGAIEHFYQLTELGRDARLLTAPIAA